MTALLLTACVGMIAGAFLIFRISPMNFTLGVFHRLTVGPRSIRDEINEATQRKKPNFMRREILEVQTILKATGKEDRFPMLCAASLLFFAMGAGIAIVLNNFLLIPVLATGMMFYRSGTSSSRPDITRKTSPPSWKQHFPSSPRPTSAVRICRPPWRRTSII